MNFSNYLLLVGAALLVTHLSGTDSYAIGRSEESKETSADNEHIDAVKIQTSTEDSTEDEDAVVGDSSEEEDKKDKVKRSAQFQTVTDTGRLPLVPMSFRNPVLVSQPNFDDISIEIFRDRVGVTPVISTQTRDQLPLDLANPIFIRSSEDFDDVSLEIVNRDRVLSQGQIVPTQTGQLPTGFTSQLVRESDGDVSLEIVRDNVTPNQQTVPFQTGINQSSNLRTPIFGQQSDEREDISLELFGSFLNQNGQLPAAVGPVQTQQPIQTFNQVNNIPSLPVTASRPQVLSFASSDRLPLVPMSFRNQIFRTSDEIDGFSAEIRNRNVFTPAVIRQQVNEPQANDQVRAPIVTANNGPEFIITQDFDGDLSVERFVDNQSVQQGFSISPVRPIVPPQQPVAGSFIVQTGNQGQQQLNVFDDYSLEDDDSNDFFLEDQFDNVDGFRLLAGDFFSPPSGNAVPSVRSVKNKLNNRKIAKKDHDDMHDSVERVSLEDSDFHVSVESDDWFLVKQYMDHEYSSEELEGELAKAYFWQPIKNSKKVKTDQDKMAELKPSIRS